MVTPGSSRVRHAVRRLATSSGIEPRLETTAALLESLGQPQEAYPGALVAGTNGKGSTCAIAARILVAHGLKTGRNPSPELVDFNERFLVDDRVIPEAVLLAALETVESAIRSAHLECTEFEVLTALAFESFRACQCDAVVAEVGMGGRWDSTNTFRPRVKAITSIGLDHMQYLGPDIPSIAAEKAGIVHSGDTLVVGELSAGARGVVSERAAQVGAEIVVASDVARVRVLEETWEYQLVTCQVARVGIVSAKLPLLGQHQRNNLAVGVLVAREVADDLQVELDAERIAWALETVQWPGRLEVLTSRTQEQRFVLDGAHNPAAMKAAVHALTALDTGTVVVVLAAFADKDVDGLIDALPRHWALVLTAMDTARTMGVEEIARRARGIGRTVLETHPTVEEALHAPALADYDTVFIAGSIHLAGEARRLLLS